MLGMLALMAMTLAGTDASLCAKDANEAALERMSAAAEARLHVAEAYAEAESEFADHLDEAGLAGSTLGRVQARAAATDAANAAEPAIARNR